MAETKTEPIVKLTETQKAAIKETLEKMPELRKEVAALKRMGMDVTALEEKLDWTDEVGKTMLDTFG